MKNISYSSVQRRHLNASKCVKLVRKLTGSQSLFADFDEYVNQLLEDRQGSAFLLTSTPAPKTQINIWIGIKKTNMWSKFKWAPSTCRISKKWLVKYKGNITYCALKCKKFLPPRKEKLNPWYFLLGATKWGYISWKSDILTWTSTFHFCFELQTVQWNEIHYMSLLSSALWQTHFIPSLDLKRSPLAVLLYRQTLILSFISKISLSNRPQFSKTQKPES